MYYCDACGWEGPKPVLSDEPMGPDSALDLARVPSVRGSGL